MVMPMVVVVVVVVMLATVVVAGGHGLMTVVAYTAQHWCRDGTVNLLFVQAESHSL